MRVSGPQRVCRVVDQVARRLLRSGSDTDGYLPGHRRSGDDVSNKQCSAVHAVRPGCEPGASRFRTTGSVNVDPCPTDLERSQYQAVTHTLRYLRWSMFSRCGVQRPGAAELVPVGQADLVEVGGHDGPGAPPVPRWCPPQSADRRSGTTRACSSTFGEACRTASAA